MLMSSVSKKYNPYILPGIRNASDKETVGRTVINKNIPDKIIDAVMARFEITRERLFSKSRSRECVLPRQICVYFLRKKTAYTWYQIKDIMNQDHVTCIYSYKTIEDQIEVDNIVSEHYHQINMILENI